jgi:hypothetical protein
MIKISFWLKKSDNEQGNLECITIDNPKKVLEGKLVGLYACEVYAPIPDIERKQHLIYADNPIHALCLASEFAKSQLQFLINRGVYVINEAESHEPWKLEKKDPQVYLQEKMDEIKNNKNISVEDKQKIFEIMKDTFGKLPHMKDQLNKAIADKA